MSYHTPHEQPVRTSTICVELLFSFDLNITTDVVIPYVIDLNRYNWCRKWNMWNADCSPIELAMSFIQFFFYFHLQVIGPKTVVLFRNRQYGFGFTLRHFIVFPPESPAVSVAIWFSSPFPMIFGNFWPLWHYPRRKTGAKHCRHPQSHATYGHRIRERGAHQWASIHEWIEAGRSSTQR